MNKLSSTVSPGESDLSESFPAPLDSQIAHLTNPTFHSDYNPLHIDPAVGKGMNFPGVILHGLCSYGAERRILRLQEV